MFLVSFFALINPLLSQIVVRELTNCWQQAGLVLNAIEGTASVIFQPTFVLQCMALPIGTVASLNISSYPTTLLQQVPDFNYSATTKITFSCPPTDLAACTLALRKVSTASMAVRTLSFVASVHIIQSAGYISQYFSCYSASLSSVVFSAIGPATTNALASLVSSNECSAIKTGDVSSMYILVVLSDGRRITFPNTTKYDDTKSEFTFEGAKEDGMAVLMDNFPMITFNAMLKIGAAALISTSTIIFPTGTNYSKCFSMLRGFVSPIGVSVDTVYNTAATPADCIEFLNGRYDISFLYAEKNGSTKQAFEINRSTINFPSSPTFTYFCNDPTCSAQLASLTKVGPGNLEGRLRIIMLDINNRMQAVAMLPMNVSLTCWVNIKASIQRNGICLSLPPSTNSECALNTIPTLTTAYLVVYEPLSLFNQTIMYNYNQSSICFTCNTLDSNISCTKLLTTIYHSKSPLRLILEQEGQSYPQFVRTIKNANYWPAWYLAICLLGVVTLSGGAYAIVLIMRVQVEVKKFKRAIKRRQHEERKRQRALAAQQHT